MTGNFLAASGLTGGTLSRGDNLEYSINGGGTLVSNSNTITSASSGLTGLQLTVLDTGTTDISVESDTGAIKTAITDFISSYNAVQSFLDTATASTTDSKGKVTAGVLAGQTDANEIATRLRRLAVTPVTGLTTAITKLSDLGISTSSDDNELTLSDEDALDTALADNLADVQEFFTNASTSLGTQLSTYLEATVGDDGSLLERQTTLTKQSTDIDTQIADMERLVQANRNSLINSFVVMERTQAKINQQLQFLQQRFGGG